jgi:7-dehydrocholesterol reductase
MDGSLMKTWSFLRQNGIQGLISIWPVPYSLTAWKIIGAYAAFEAALQLLLPGKQVYGPISPMGNRPVYKVRLATQTSQGLKVSFFSECNVDDYM